MRWLHCVSTYFRGWPIFLVFSNIFRLIFESAYFRRSANFRGNTVFQETETLKRFFIFRKMEPSSPLRENFLYFRKRKPPQNYLYFRKQKPQKSLYISGNGTFLYFRKQNFLILQETKLSYILGNVYSER